MTDRTDQTPSPQQKDQTTAKLAVALEYDPKKAGAPRVVAAGRNAIAEQILAVAAANGVEIRQDADLAQVLSAVRLDTEIPLEAFAAVAEILGYIYQKNGERPPTAEEPATVR